LPVELWTNPLGLTDKPERVELGLEDRKVAAKKINYVILVGGSYSQSYWDALDLRLWTHPAIAGAGDGERLNFAMAPMTQNGSLAMADLRFDVLELLLVDEALAIPLAPGNWQAPRDTESGRAHAARAICMEGRSENIWFCRE
jgi:hypothetical protein